jgi:hypothetical protein
LPNADERSNKESGNGELQAANFNPHQRLLRLLAASTPVYLRFLAPQ